MPTGIWVWDDEGNLLLSPSLNMFKAVTSVYVNTSVNPTGSIADDNFLRGTPEALCVGTANYDNTLLVTFSGNVASWSNPSGGFWAGYVYFGIW